MNLRVAGSTTHRRRTLGAALHGCQWHAQRRGVALIGNVDACALAQFDRLRRGRTERDAYGVGARLRIGGGRDLADRAG